MSTEGNSLKVRAIPDSARFGPYMLPILLSFSSILIELFSDDLAIAEDNMNVQLKDITVTARDGRVSHLDQVYIRGSHVKFFIVPDMLRYASYRLLHASLFYVCNYISLIHPFPSTEMLRCSDPEASEDEVLVWREAGQLLTEQEASEEAKGPMIGNEVTGQAFLLHLIIFLPRLFADTIAERNITT